MYTSKNDFRVGEVDVSPILNHMKHGSEVIKIEPLIMDVLVFLSNSPGEIILRAEFITKVQAMEDSSDESLTRAVSMLRKVFREFDGKNEYIETIPKRGYRLLQKVVQSTPSPQFTETYSSLLSPDRAQAYELYIQGRSLNQRPFHGDVLTTSVSLLEEAIELDHGFADAHSELGHTYSLMSTYLWEGDKRALIRKAAECAEHALELDSNSAFALTLIALEQFTLGNIVGALELTEEAYSRNSKDPEIALRLGYFYAAIGQIKRGIPYIQQAVDTDPTQGRNLQILATGKLCNGDLDEAEIIAKRAVDMQHQFARETYAAIAFAKGEYGEAVQRFLSCRNYLSGFLRDAFVEDTVWEQIAAAAYSTDRKTREMLGEWAMSFLHKPGTFPSVALAQTIVRAGPASAFFEIMGDTPPPGTHGTLLCIWGDTDVCHSIRDHEDFPAFTQRMGMDKAWEKYGKPDCMQ